MDELIRSVPFELIRADDGDGLTLEGYAAVFDSPTEIDSWEGNFLETVQRGAFKKTLRERTPVLMFDHGQHPLVGQLPIGTIKSAREDARGLYVAARLADNWLVEPVRDAIRDGAINGMSFRFRVVRDQWDEPKKGLRTRNLLEVSMSELGPVVFPAYRETSVAVRSLLDRPDIRAELAQLLSTSTDAAREGTSEDAARSLTETPDQQGTTSRNASDQRRRALQFRGVIPSEEDRGAA